MKFQLTRTSDKEFRKKVELDSLEDLMNLIEEYSSDLIVSEDVITIYDDYEE